MKKRVVSRRTFLRSSAGAGMGAAAIGLVGCGDDDDDDEVAPSAATGTAAAAAQPKRGGKAAYQPSTGIAHLDMHQSSFWGAGTFSPPMYSTLMRLRPPDLLPEPSAATAMPEQPDQTTFIFKLRPNIKFHNKPPVNGRQATAEDLLFSLERARTPDAVFQNGSHLSAVDKIEAVDKLTLKITTKQPDAVMITIMGLYPFAFIAKEVIDKFGDLKAADAAIGTGPFILDKYNQGNNITYKRNPEYFREGLPYLDELEGITLTDPFSRFLSGNLSYVTVPGPQIVGFDKRYPQYPTHSTSNQGTASAWVLNNDRMFKDVRVRRAMALLTDFEQFMPFFTSNAPGTRQSIILGHAHVFWNLSEEETKKLEFYHPENYDKQAAEGIKLLEAAGYTPSKPLELDDLVLETGSGAPTGTDRGDFMKTMLERGSKGAVKTKLRVVDYGTVINSWSRSQFDITYSSFVNGPDPDQAISTMHRSNGGRNYGKTNDPTLDALIDKQRQTFNVDERKKVVQDALRRVADQVPYVWTGYAPQLIAVQPDVHGFLNGGSIDNWLFEEVWKG